MEVSLIICNRKLCRIFKLYFVIFCFLSIEQEIYANNGGTNCRLNTSHLDLLCNYVFKNLICKSFNACLVTKHSFGFKKKE